MVRVKHNTSLLTDHDEFDIVVGLYPSYHQHHILRVGMTHSSRLVDSNSKVRVNGNRQQSWHIIGRYEGFNLGLLS